jgi:hypothetical protein
MAPVIVVFGPKTFSGHGALPQYRSQYLLENPARLEQLLTALEGLRGTVAIDEIQHRWDLFPILRVIADRKPLPARFLTAVPLRNCFARAAMATILAPSGNSRRKSPSFAGS